MRGSKLIVLCAAMGGALALSACAETNTVFRTTEYGNGKAIFVDAFQRAIHVSPRVEETATGESKKTTTFNVVCAELPPPAFAAFGNATSAGLQSGPRTLDLSLAAAQASGYMDLKTQLTKVHGEFLYRLCEAFNNGAISKSEAEIEYRRFQNTTVALAAIEQLTGYARPTVVALGAGGNADTGDQLAQAQNELASARDNETKTASAAADAKVKATKASSDYDAKVKELDAAKQAKKSQEELNKLQAEVDAMKKASDEAEKAGANATAAAKDAVEVRKTKEAVFEASKAVSAGAGTSPVIVNVPGLSPSASDKVADTVKSIVETHLHQSFASDLCLHFLFGGQQPSAEDPRVKYCVNHLNLVDAERAKKGDLYGVMLKLANPELQPR
ncbi:MAG: hypothetical protein H7Z12_14990 [Rhodospirillaceae bacterium]|nr:hypothetical protein [Rhodospirillales bacterium]